jgi:transcriptional regulator with XRE-family HTH domain
LAPLAATVTSAGHGRDWLGKVAFEELEGEMAQEVQGVIKIGGVDFVLVPVAEYLRLGGDASRLASTRSLAKGAASVAKRLYDARRHAGLTQAQLAKRLGKSQPMVSQAESGAARVSERYVRTVLDACRLPSTWRPARTEDSGARSAEGLVEHPAEGSGESSGEGSGEGSGESSGEGSGESSGEGSGESSELLLVDDEIAGLDPLTLEPVRRGSKRDEELRRTLVWWSNA